VHRCVFFGYTPLSINGAKLPRGEPIGALLL